MQRCQKVRCPSEAIRELSERTTRQSPQRVLGLAELVGDLRPVRAIEMNAAHDCAITFRQARHARQQGCVRLLTPQSGANARTRPPDLRKEFV